MAGKIGIMGNLYDLNISSIRPNKARLEVNINGKTLVQAVDGDNGWTINPFMGSSKPTKLDPKTAKNLKNIAGFKSIIYTLKNEGYKLELGKEDTVAGKNCFVIKATDSEGNITTHYIDKESYLTVKSSSFVEIEEDKYETIKWMNNFKEFSGVVWATEIVNVFKPNLQGGNKSIQFDKIEINKEIDDKIFVMPVE